MNDIQKNTCIRFVQRTGETAYVQITAGFSGCWSSIGYSGSRVYVNLQRPGCVRKIGTIEHELMHAMGFIHEQARSDRDDKVIIQWRNIKPGKLNYYYLNIFIEILINFTSVFCLFIYHHDKMLI